MTRGGNETLSRDDAPVVAGTDGGDDTLYLLLECDRPRAASARHVLGGLDRVRIGRAGDRESGRAGVELDLGVPDSRMSQEHAVLVRELGRWIALDAGSKNGVIVNGVRHRRAVLGDGDLVELGHTLFLFRDRGGDAPLPPDCDAADLAQAAQCMRTFVPALLGSFADLTRVAASRIAVLIHGESGTGKELLARAVHRLAARAGPLVAVNCGALPATLVESELFGYRKGAFSGADADRDGLVRSAEGGTLLLDEIGDLPLGSQASLLRVLQEREVIPLGSSRPIPVDVQVVAATHHELEEMVAGGRFRRDLYARIAQFVIRLPPLRGRREDLGLLVAALLERRGSGAAALRFHVGAARAMFRYDWPLNVRELEACLDIAGALADDGVIRVEHLPEPVRTGVPAGPRGAAPLELSAADARRREQLIDMLRENGGNISAVARVMGKARVQIHRWLKRYHIDASRYRGP
jgi:transcriptional regulator with AAA-type ATPase domain